MAIFRESVLDMMNPAVINVLAQEQALKRLESRRRGEIAVSNFDFSGLI